MRDWIRGTVVKLIFEINFSFLNNRFFFYASWIKQVRKVWQGCDRLIDHEARYKLQIWPSTSKHCIITHMKTKGSIMIFNHIDKSGWILTVTWLSGQVLSSVCLRRLTYSNFQLLLDQWLSTSWKFRRLCEIQTVAYSTPNFFQVGLQTFTTFE